MSIETWLINFFKHIFYRFYHIPIIISVIYSKGPLRITIKVLA